MTHTTDPNDPALTHGVDSAPVPQADKYLILSEEERQKGYQRPVRRSYVHVGHIPGVEIPVVLTPEFVSEHRDGGGCFLRTTMSVAIAETYARDPKFYGSTYCVSCQKHMPVADFVWAGTTERVGS